MTLPITVVNVTLKSQWTENSAAAGEGSASQTIWEVSALGWVEIPVPGKPALHDVTIVAAGMKPRKVKAAEFLASYTPVT